ncbi:hypothetical protein ACET3Z_024222 [Daucus carota]
MHEMTPTDQKKHSLPLAPLKRIMKGENDVRMIVQKTVVVFAKACGLAKLSFPEEEEKGFVGLEVPSLLFRTVGEDFTRNDKAL